MTTVEGTPKKKMSEVTAVRLLRLRRNDELQVPSEVIVQLVLDQAGVESEAFGHSKLTSEGNPVMVSAMVWEAAEQVLTRLPGVVLTGDASLDRAQLEDLIESAADAAIESFDERQQLAYKLITDAYRSALDAALGEPSGDSEPVDIFDADVLNRTQRYAVAPGPEELSIDGEFPNAYDDAPYIEPLPKDGTKGHLLEREALRYGLNTERFPKGAFIVSDSEGNRLGFKWGRSPLASGVALSICTYKEATRQLLEQVGVPVPKGRVFPADDTEGIIDYAEYLGYPIVIKPSAGLRGIGVVSGIRNKSQLLRAMDVYRKSQMGTDDMVVERQVPGNDYRIVIIGDQVVASGVREAASVIGDGVHTVADLVEYKNRLRRKNPHLSSRLIHFSPAVDYQLSEAGLTYGSIPEKGQKVVLANSANLSQGGDSYEVTAELHPSIKELAVKAVKAVPGLGFCGLDMLIEDHRKPIWEQEVTVIELNAHAAIGTVQYPMWGVPAPVSKVFFEETAKRAGVDLPDEQLKEICVELTIRGRVNDVGFERWFSTLATRFDVTGYVKRAGQRTMKAVLCGPADAVSALVYGAASGPSRAVPTSVKAVQIEPQQFEAFSADLS